MSKKYIVYTQANKLGLKGEFDNAKDAIKWAKENVYAFDYLKERKDTWEILFEEFPPLSTVTVSPRSFTSRLSGVTSVSSVVN